MKYLGHCMNKDSFIVELPRCEVELFMRLAGETEIGVDTLATYYGGRNAILYYAARAVTLEGQKGDETPEAYTNRIASRMLEITKDDMLAFKENLPLFSGEGGEHAD